MTRIVLDLKKDLTNYLYNDKMNDNYISFMTFQNEEFLQQINGISTISYHIRRCIS